MSRKFRWFDGLYTHLSKDFIWSYNEDNDVGKFLEVYVQYLKVLLELHIDLSFLRETTYMIKKFVIHIINLKEVLNHGWTLKSVFRAIKFNQEASLKPCTGMNNK